MSKEIIVVALGGNALGKNCKEQRQLVRETAKPIVDLIEEGNTIVLTHGNGPQVGMINNAFVGSELKNMPFPECGAMSQGYIGYHLQNAIRTELKERNLPCETVSIVTQVLVDKEDPAFDDPRKPIGSFYTKEEADKIAEEYGYTMHEDSNRGYRRVVPSPEPVDIIEKDSIKALIDRGITVIASGGGGIPVIKEDGDLNGVAAVIDKDNSAALLADLLNADRLLILTAVDAVYLNYGKENQQELRELEVEEVEKYIEEGHFAKGSMLPKVGACLKFVKAREGRSALITSLVKAKDGLEGKCGTLIKS